MRKTKIICTLGPSSSDESTLREMMRLGMNVCRFNFSHGTHEEHREKLSTVKRLREELKLPVATLLDTKGPEIRLRDFEGGSVVLAAGERFTITTREVMGDASIGSITYAGLPGDVSAGSRILIDDGLVELVVESIQDTDIHCTVKNGGKISNHKGINVPGVSLSIPYLSEADKADLLYRLRKMQDMDADIPKIAVMPQGPADVVTLLDATQEMYTKYADRPIITMSMSNGVISRLCGECFGSSMTFGAVGQVSAPGQIPVEQLNTALKILHDALAPRK